MHGYIPPLPNVPSWRSDQVKHRDDFTFTFYIGEYRRPALNDSKTNHHQSSAIKCTGEINIFLRSGPRMFLMCSVDVNMAIFSGPVHIKTIFSLWTGVDKHFIGNALCSADGCHVTNTHFLKVNSAFTNPYNTELALKSCLG
jgi:hypothetical protein